MSIKRTPVAQTRTYSGGRMSTGGSRSKRRVVKLTDNERFVLHAVEVGQTWHDTAPGRSGTVGRQNTLASLQRKKVIKLGTHGYRVTGLGRREINRDRKAHGA